jgi:carboxymethylenebutenolidase
MQQQELTLTYDEGAARAYLAGPEQGGPGVLLLHAWWGLNAFYKSLGDRFAEAGFVALAPDLFDGRVATTIEEATELSQSGDAGPTPQIVRAAAESLLGQPGRTGAKIGVVGFSFGAWYAAQLAAELPEEVGAVVLYYGAVDADFARSRAAYLAHLGELDEYEPLEYVRQMEQGIRDAGREVTLHVYPQAGHWFVEEDRPDAYQADAAALAWERTVAFLREQLG